jgi:hypothetical protein
MAPVVSVVAAVGKQEMSWWYVQPCLSVAILTNMDSHQRVHVAFEARVMSGLVIIRVTHPPFFIPIVIHVLRLGDKLTTAMSCTYRAWVTVTTHLLLSRQWVCRQRQGNHCSIVSHTISFMHDDKQQGSSPQHQDPLRDVFASILKTDCSRYGGIQPK